MALVVSPAEKQKTDPALYMAESSQRDLTYCKSGRKHASRTCQAMRILQAVPTEPTGATAPEICLGDVCVCLCTRVSPSLSEILLSLVFVSL